MNSYELTIILRNKELDAVKGKAREILQKFGVKIIKEDPWGVRRLAYQINGEKEGYYDFMIVEAAPESITKIINDFRLNSDILRYLFVNIKQEKSA